MQSRDRHQSLLAGSLLVLLAFSGTAAGATFEPSKEAEWTVLHSVRRCLDQVSRSTGRSIARVDPAFMYHPGGV